MELSQYRSDMISSGSTNDEPCRRVARNKITETKTNEHQCAVRSKLFVVGYKTARSPVYTSRPRVVYIVILYRQSILAVSSVVFRQLGVLFDVVLLVEVETWNEERPQ